MVERGLYFPSIGGVDQPHAVTQAEWSLRDAESRNKQPSDTTIAMSGRDLDSEFDKACFTWFDVLVLHTECAQTRISQMSTLTLNVKDSATPQISEEAIIEDRRQALAPCRAQVKRFRPRARR